jgi:hypothetical protein
MALDVDRLRDKLKEKNKDELNKLAREKFGKSVELTDNLEPIVNSVVELYVEHDKLVMKQKEAGIKSGKLPEYFKNPKTGHIFDASLALQKMTNLIPCKKNGDVIRG